MTLRGYQPSFTAGELAPSLHGRTDLAGYASGLRTCRNFFLHAHGGVSTRPGFRFLGFVKDGPVRLVAFQFSTVQQYVLEFGAGYLRVHKDGGTVLKDGAPYELATPYTAADLPGLAWTQSADTLFLVHPGHPPQRLTRRGHADWTLAAMVFGPSLSGPATLSAAATGSGGTAAVLKYRVTAISADTGEQSLPSPEVSVTGWTPGNWPQGAKITLSWPAVDGVVEYRVYKEDNGLYGHIGATGQTGFSDTNITPDLARTPPVARTPFDGPGRYPSAAAFYEQRLFLAATDQAPQTVWGSAINAYGNFNTSRPVREDEAVTFTVAAAQVNAVRHIVPLGDMILLTSGGEWRVGGGSDGAALTPASVRLKPQGYRGAARVRPMVVGNTILYVQDKGSIVRDLAYSLEVDGFTGDNLSILSGHLFDGHTLTDWAYAQVPHSIVWAVRDDGVLLGLTYLREHRVWGWHRHDTDGVVEAVCTVSEGAEDVLYAVIRRTLDGTERRCLERLAERRWTTAEAAFCVDCGLSYSGPPVTEVAGLEHLEGREVAILAGGDVLARQTVSGGRVRLPRPYGRVQVGLPYSCEIETLDLDPGSTAQGSVQGRRRSVPRVTVRVQASRGFRAGSSADRLVAVRQHQTVLDAPLALHDGLVDLTLDPGWSSHGRVVIRQEDPLPLTVLAIVPEVDFGG